MRTKYFFKEKLAQIFKQGLGGNFQYSFSNVFLSYFQSQNKYLQMDFFLLNKIAQAANTTEN